MTPNNSMFDDLEMSSILVVFDFDDTLVKTDSSVVVVHEDGSRTPLTTGQYATYVKLPGDTLDYSSFRTLVNPRIIRHVGKRLKTAYEQFGPASIVVLTARGGETNYIVDFLSDAGFPGIEVVGLGCDAKTTAVEKATWVANKIRRDNLAYVEFLDDSQANVDAIKLLAKRFPHVKIVTKTIKPCQ